MAAADYLWLHDKDSYAVAAAVVKEVFSKYVYSQSEAFLIKRSTCCPPSFLKFLASIMAVMGIPLETPPQQRDSHSND